MSIREKERKREKERFMFHNHKKLMLFMIAMIYLINPNPNPNMFATNTIAVFEGSKGREYYSIHNPCVSANRSVYYDIDFPLQLALKMDKTDNNTGFKSCIDCQLNGTYKNIAIIPCGNCIQQFPKYKCNCFDGRMSLVDGRATFEDYINSKEIGSGVHDLTPWRCGPDCVWFASKSVYGVFDPKTVSLSKSHRNEFTIHDMRDIFTTTNARITKDDDDDIEDDREFSDGSLESSTEKAVIYPFSSAEQSILDQFSSFCDRVMHGDP